MADHEFQDMIALVTGAGRGIGKAIALELARQGIKVAVNYFHSKEKAEQTVSEIIASGGIAKAYPGDVSDFNQVSEMCKQIKQDLGGINILVNNSGMVKDCSLLRMRVDDWNQVIATNLSGSFHCIKAVSFEMMKKGWGRIINIGSLSWYNGAPGQANYAASKAGLVGLTRCLACELAATGVTVNMVIPGLISTDIIGDIPDEKLKGMASRIPTGRMGTGKDIAEIVSFLASPKSGYITGQLITSDGGLSCGL